MKSLPDKSIDCFICDLPYGQLTSPKGSKEHIKAEVNGGQMNGCNWDIKIDLKAFWEQVERLAKHDNTPVIHFCNTKFGIELINSKPGWFRYDLVWNKERGVSFLLANKMPMKSHEMIYIFSKKGTYYNRVDIDGRRCSLSVINIKKVGTFKNLHPTEKPKELYQWLLSRYCPPGGTVLDPTAGSFNSIEVAKDLGLKAIGIEMDENFYKKAVEKFKE
jgi:site-specific DNA-methyltransferase (adenine-specific)